MQTELKREWLLQLIEICSGLTSEEHSFLTTLISRMDLNHEVDLIDEESDDNSLWELLERNMVKWVVQYKRLILLPKFQIIGNDLHGIAFKLSVMLNGEDVIVNKTYDKFKLRDDTIS